MELTQTTREHNIENFTTIKFIHHTKLDSNFDTLTGYYPFDVKISYCIFISGEKINTEFMIYRSGKKYCIGSTKKNSISKLYEDYLIPKKYLKDFNSLRKLYNEKFKK